MDIEIAEIRKQSVEKILAAQDDLFRWGFNEKQARERPEYVYYSPNFKSTLWTLILLADIKAPADHPQIRAALQLITEHFFEAEHGIFGFPGGLYFPIPCLNGNMLYLHQYFETRRTDLTDETIHFFAATQRFDDGDFKTPKTYPYCANSSCYGKHTCYWGVTKLMKGISFIPRTERSGEAQRLMENCIDFVLQHEVCFGSHHPDKFLQRDIDKLSFPNFYKSDFLEILWLLAREDVRDAKIAKISRAVELLRSKMRQDGTWELEKSANTIVSTGQKDGVHAFITERAIEVLEHFG